MHWMSLILWKPAEFSLAALIAVFIVCIISPPCFLLVQTWRQVAKMQKRDFLWEGFQDGNQD
ncbi:MAG: hypothetical protein A2Z78_01805 [Candidatus Nealsonbacteria bacterium RBG_13_36_15]|uniref:Uncharacterized protein n=1 Tax=Candidatus Nealsonbacteria bacterium RBG_13_36_15 TaxID=1801660 RepID=A0A1G2DY59_9BACT|nr:MAG: hypothetical protein A2Z78_01805 [Candidatus Nealsonbacteria bacterium RBG_13_36_15]